jgi:ankyrin
MQKQEDYILNHSKLNLIEKAKYCIENNLCQTFQKLLSAQIEKGTDLTFIRENDTDKSLLHYSVLYNSYKITKYLLNYCQIDVNCQDKFGKTPLIIATMQSDATHVSELLRHGANANIKDDSLNFALNIAINEKYETEIAELLLMSGADLNLRGRKGNTVLHEACERNNWKGIEFMLSRNELQITIRNSRNETALFSAIAHPTLLYKLCSLFSEKDYTQYLQKAIQSTNENNETVLQSCANHLRFISFCVLLHFIDSDRDKPKNLKIQELLNLKDKMRGNTMLHNLLQKQIEIANKIDNSAHQFTMYYKTLKQFILLLVCSREVDVNVQNHYGETPLHIALKENCQFYYILLNPGDCDTNSLKD